MIYIETKMTSMPKCCMDCHYIDFYHNNAYCSALYNNYFFTDYEQPKLLQNRHELCPLTEKKQKNIIWKNIQSYKPENNTIYIICIFNSIYKKSIPADSMAIYDCGKWYWWVDGRSDEVKGKVTYFCELCFSD